MTTLSTLPIAVLDHGYVTPIEHWGSDERIIEAARMSTAKGFQGWGQRPCDMCDGSGSTVGAFIDEICERCKGTGELPGDEKLLRYLWENRHATPFEMAGLVVEVQAPIFVFREWHRHRTQSYNEMSARYVPLPDVNYVPTVERLLANAGTANRQAASTGAALTSDRANDFRAALARDYENAEASYQASLADGVPKELARLVLPVGRYSRMRASANLRNWLAFLTLRMDRAAQWEIRQYANAVGQLIAARWPKTWELFVEGARK